MPGCIDDAGPGGVPPHAAIAALERRFDGPIPPRLLAAAAAGGAVPADRSAAAGEARVLTSMAQACRRTIARRRAVLDAAAAAGDDRLRALCDDLAGLRHLAANRLSAAAQG